MFFSKHISFPKHPIELKKYMNQFLYTMTTSNQTMSV